MTKLLNNADVKGYIAQTAVTSSLLKTDSNGKLVAATAGTDYQAPTTALLPAGGTAGQILSKINATDYNTQWIDNFAAQLKHEVKLGATLSKGAAVYVSSANGTNMIVSAASNASEATSSKTLGLLETGGVTNDLVKVITEGLLAGLDTSTATAGDPVWLGVNGALIFGLANKPVAPAHMVFIGIVTRAQSNNGEIFVKVQNGFELDELHNVSISSLANNQTLVWESATSLWKNKTIAAALGYTPADDAAVVKLTGDQTVAGVKTFTSVVNAPTLSLNGGILSGNNIVSMRSNPTGGQFRIEKSDGSLSAYPFYIGVDGTALAYYYNALGALKVLLHTDGTSYFGNSLSVGYSTYGATSYMLDVNGTANIVGALTGTTATFSSTITGNRNDNTTNVSAVLQNSYINAGNLIKFVHNSGGSTTNGYIGHGGDSTGNFVIINNGINALTLARDTGAATFASTISLADYININGSTNAYLNLNAANAGGNEAGVYFKIGGTAKWEQYTAANDGNLSFWSNGNGIRFYITPSGGATFASSITAREALFKGDATDGGIVTITRRYSTGAQTINFNNNHPVSNLDWTGARITSADAGNYNGYLDFAVSLGNNGSEAAGTAAVASVMRLTKDKRVGINTTSPSKTLHIYTTNNEGIFLQGTAGGVWMDMQSAAGNLWSIGAQNDGMGVYNRTSSAYSFFIKDNRQLQIAGYTSATSYTGTAAGYLAFDSSGNVITVAGVAATDNTKLPLTGGALTGPLTITGNGSYLGDWGYKTLELNDTSGYPGIFFRNGNNIWIIRRNGADNAMDWAYSTDASAQGTGTFTHKMRLASDQWWVSTYPNYKMRIIGGDVLEALNGTSATTLYLQYHSNTGGNLNIAASKFIFYNTGHFYLGGGSDSGQSQLSSGLTSIKFPNQYSSGYTDAGVKLYIFNSGATIQGFTAGPAYDLQYHSSGSDSGRHAFYVANSEIIRFSKTIVGVSGILQMATSGTSYISMGRFPNSVSNSGEAWLGRASDRSTGTMTVQLGGGSNSSFFEVVDYGWTTVTLKVGMNDFSYKGNAVLHAGNIGSQTVLGINAQFLGTGSMNVSYGYTTVLRNENGSGGAVTYAPLLHMSASDTMWQLQGTYGTSGNGTLYFRQGYSGSWGNWLTMLSSANYNSYSPTLTGGGASGTWGINVTGSSRSLLFSGDSAKQFSDGQWAGGGSYPGYAFTGGNSRFGFSSTSGVIDVYTDGNFYATDSSYLVWHQGNLTNLNQLSNGPGYQTNGGQVNNLSTNYAGGQQLNPQVYFNNGIGLKVAMTASWGYWSDTMWVNGYAGGDVPWMCALHFQRNSQPRMAISAQQTGSTGYGTLYEVVTGWNSPYALNMNQYVRTSDDVNFQFITGARRVQGEYIYSLGWTYSNGNCGWYNDTYGQGLRQVKGNYTYGNILTHGENYNGWAGYVAANGIVTAFMQNSAGTHGFYQENGAGWTAFYNYGYACWGLGTDATDPSYSLHITKYGGSNTGWIIWSDRRIKENIKTIDSALDKVLSLRGVYYNKIDDPNKERQVGYIAQEVMEVVPELVVYSEELDIYNMNYAPMVSMLTEATKEHYAKTLAQQAEIDTLKEQVQTLLNHINNGV